MLIQFDPDLQAEILQRQGLDLARAGEMFDGLMLTLRQQSASTAGVRCVSIGWLDGRIIVTGWHLIDDAARILSMRFASDQECARYARHFG